MYLRNIKGNKIKISHCSLPCFLLLGRVCAMSHLCWLCIFFENFDVSGGRDGGILPRGLEAEAWVLSIQGQARLLSKIMSLRNSFHNSILKRCMHYHTDSIKNLVFGGWRGRSVVRSTGCTTMKTWVLTAAPTKWTGCDLAGAFNPGEWGGRDGGAASEASGFQPYRKHEPSDHIRETVSGT